MSDVRTQAGRTLLSWRGQHATWTEARWVEAIRAIEKEATTRLDCGDHYIAGYKAGLAACDGTILDPVYEQGLRDAGYLVDKDLP